MTMLPGQLQVNRQESWGIIQKNTRGDSQVWRSAAVGEGGGSDLACGFAFRYYLDSRTEGAMLRAVLRS